MKQYFVSFGLRISVKIDVEELEFNYNFSIIDLKNIGLQYALLYFSNIVK